MLAITDVIGETKHVNGIQSIVRSRKVNGEKSIDLISVPAEGSNYDFVDTESLFLFQNEPYIIKKISEKNQGRYSIKTAHCVHRFFDDMINSFQYENFTGSQTFAAALTRVFGPTIYDFSIVDSFTAESFENFGRDNCLSLFQTILERYGAEFEVIGTRVYLRRQIGSDTGFQLRWKHNIKSIEKQVDTENLATYIRGFGGEPNDSGVYPIQREYDSNMEIFGELHAEAVYDERITTVAGMDARLRQELIDEPQLSITVDIAAIEGNPRNEGDRGYIIYEPMKIKVSARAVEINETFNYHERKWKVRQTAVTLSNLRNKLTDVTTRFAQTSKQFDRLMEGREKLPYNVLPEAVRRATEILVNDNANFIYDAGYVMGINKDNDNYRTRMTSQGFGVTKDGGATFPNAITHEGVVTEMLTAGAIHTNNIAIIGDSLFFWDGNGFQCIDPDDLDKFVKITGGHIDIAKGAISITRPDGYVVMNNGLLQNDFTLQPTNPTFRNKPTVSEVGVYWATTETEPQNCEAYFFAHKSRYLKMMVVAHDLGSGKGSRIGIYEVGGGGVTLAQTAVYNATDATSISTVLTVDLGVPNGGQRGVYVRLNTTTGGEARGRIVKAWLEQ